MDQLDPISPASSPAEGAADLLIEVVPRLYRVLRATLDEDPDLPSLEQLRVMTRIDQGIQHAAELAVARQMRASAITPLIDGLVRRGWVERTPDREDRRRYRLELTQAGHSSMAAGRAQAQRQLREVLRCGPTPPPGTPIDIVGAMAWLERAVHEFDRPGSSPPPPGR